MTKATITPSFRRALPFWVSLGAPPLIWAVSMIGGWTIALVPLFAWPLFSLIDAALGTTDENADPETPDRLLTWYRAVTLLWAPIQFFTIFGIIAYLTHTDHLATHEELAIAFGLGVISGTIGVVYAHELLHQSPRIERLAGDLLMAMVLYSHFRSEHLLVHHRYVGTPKDAVTARYNEGFHRFFYRTLTSELPSAWRAEKAMLARRKLPVWHRSNPFWFYGVLQLACLGLALAIGGVWGVVLFAVQAFVAADPRYQTFFQQVMDLTVSLLPAFKEEGKTSLTLAFGCTGGQHRSVALAENAANVLAETGWQVSTRHRELERRGLAGPTAETGKRA